MGEGEVVGLKPGKHFLEVLGDALDGVGEEQDVVNFLVYIGLAFQDPVFSLIKKITR